MSLYSQCFAVFIVMNECAWGARVFVPHSHPPCHPSGLSFPSIDTHRYKQNSGGFDTTTNEVNKKGVVFLQTHRLEQIPSSLYCRQLSVSSNIRCVLSDHPYSALEVQPGDLDSVAGLLNLYLEML